MTREEFKKLPHLVMEGAVVELGYGRRTIAKFVDSNVLRKIQPAGAGHGKYQKKQVAQLLGVGWTELLDEAAFRKEPQFMGAKAVNYWTGYCETTLKKIADAGGLTFRKPPGMGKGRFLKAEIAKLIGFETAV